MALPAKNIFITLLSRQKQIYSLLVDIMFVLRLKVATFSFDGTENKKKLNVQDQYRRFLNGKFYDFPERAYLRNKTLQK